MAAAHGVEAIVVQPLLDCRLKSGRILGDPKANQRKILYCTREPYPSSFLATRRTRCGVRRLWVRVSTQRQSPEGGEPHASRQQPGPHGGASAGGQAEAKGRAAAAGEDRSADAAVILRGGRAAQPDDRTDGSDIQTRASWRFS